MRMSLGESVCWKSVGTAFALASRDTEATQGTVLFLYLAMSDVTRRR